MEYNFPSKQNHVSVVADTHVKTKKSNKEARISFVANTHAKSRRMKSI